MSGDAFFGGWSEIGRVGVVGIAAYAGLVLMLRVSGKRTLSKLNAFDLVVTVALGSTLASILTSSELSLATGLAALALLIVLQFAVSWSTVRWRPVNRAMKSEPAVLLRRGVCLPAVMRRERVAEDEMLAAVRQSGEKASPTRSWCSWNRTGR